MTQRRASRSGQALIMVTIALLAMSGLIGMAVDFGWSYFVRRTAQSAADAGALAAANSALDAIMGGQTTYLALGGHATPASCSTGFGDNRQSACQFAQQNGFSSGQVQISADTNSPYPAGVFARYWVTVQISSSIPQLYSALLGNPYATIGAKATAAIFDSPVSASIIGLNRENDAQPGNMWQASPGIYKPDLMLGVAAMVGCPPGPTCPAPQPGTGIALASTDPGSGDNQSSLTPYVPNVLSRGGLAGAWINSSSNQSDGTSFYDPFRGMGQPPLSTSPLTNYVPVPNGNLDATVCAGGTCSPGIYYATANGTPSGGPITISSSSSLTFSGATAGSFSDYVFYGGLNINGGTVTLGPGRYVMAGVSSPGSNVLTISPRSTVNGGDGTDAGRLLILTDGNYPGLQQSAPPPAGLQASSLTFGQTSISGSGNKVSLVGLNSSGSQPLPSDANSQSSTLEDFGPVLIWQDQRFSNVKYTASGNIDISCGSMESPCTNAAPPTNPQLTLGGAVVNADGVIYQPRGAWLRIQPLAVLKPPLTANPHGPLLISGAFDFGAGASVNPDGELAPRALRLRRVALVE